MKDLNQVRVLTEDDVPAAMRLKEAAGWNQTQEDWKRLLSLAGNGCFGLQCDGALAATMTTICYGNELAWIGMALTAPNFRRLGFAGRLMEHTLTYLRNCGVSWVKLDATDMGVPVYEKFSFKRERQVERWRRGRSSISQDSLNGLRPLSGCDLSIDPAAFGADRKLLLRDLAKMGGACTENGAFAMWRLGTEACQFGPCVAPDVASAESLLQSALQENAGEPIYWDLPSDNAGAVSLASSYGFECQRKLWRMATALHPNVSPLGCQMDLIFALAGFEYG
jgi:GNAT superfamily N-acetyltransferase